MRRNDQYAIVLDFREVEAVAQRLIARHLEAEADEISDWGLIPEASQLTHAEIVQAVRKYAIEALRVSKNYDGISGIDSAHLIEQLS